MTRLLTILIGCISILGALSVKAQETMSLEGQWSVKLDTLDVGIQQKWFNQHYPGRT